MRASFWDAPGDADGALARARDLVAARRYDEALDEYGAAARISPYEERAYCGMALVLIAAGRPHDAVESMYSVLEIRPGAAYPRGVMGAIMEELGILDDALEYYDEMIDAGSPDAAAYVRKAQLLQHLGRTGACARTLEACRAAQLPGCALPKARERLKEILGGAGQKPAFRSGDRIMFVPGLEEALRVALGERVPGGSLPERAAGPLLLAGRQERADILVLLEAGLQDTPGSPGMLCARGLILEEDGRAGEALASYDRAIEAEPGYMAAYVQKCVLLLDEGDKRGVAKCVRAALRAEPEHELDVRMQEDLRGWENVTGSRALSRFTATSNRGAVIHHAAKWLEGYRAPPVRRRARRRPKHRRMSGRGMAWEPGGTGLFPPGLLD